MENKIYDGLYKLGTYKGFTVCLEVETETELITNETVVYTTFTKFKMLHEVDSFMEDLEELADSIINSSTKSELYDLLEEHDCKPSDLLDTLAEHYNLEYSNSEIVQQLNDEFPHTTYFYSEMEDSYYKTIDFEFSFNGFNFKEKCNELENVEFQNLLAIHFLESNTGIDSNNKHYHDLRRYIHQMVDLTY